MIDEIKSQRISRFVLVVLILGVIGLILAIVPVSFSDARAVAQRNHCMGCMHLIHSAIVSTALANRIQAGQQIPAALFIEYLPHKKLPECPSGGSYEIPPVGGILKCTVHGEAKSTDTR